MKQKDSEVEQVKADLDIEEHLSMQEKGWRIQLFGLCGIFGLMLTAAIGLYGDGFVSKKTIDQNEIKVEYQEYDLEDANRALLELKQGKIRGAKVLRL